MKPRTVLLSILILVAIDQTIKILINTYFGGSSFDIIPSLLEFKPVFNDKHSYVNVLLNQHLGINVGLLPHILLFFIAGVIISAYLIFFRNNINSYKKLLDASIIFLSAILICAFLGNLIWEKGTLDYIYLKPLFVFDLKDAYGNAGFVLFLVYAIKNQKELKSVKNKDVFLYLKSRIMKNRK